jgi:hypothetical protein
MLKKQKELKDKNEQKYELLFNEIFDMIHDMFYKEEHSLEDYNKLFNKYRNSMDLVVFTKSEFIEFCKEKETA